MVGNLKSSAAEKVFKSFSSLSYLGDNQKSTILTVNNLLGICYISSVFNKIHQLLNENIMKADLKNWIKSKVWLKLPSSFPDSKHKVSLMWVTNTRVCWYIFQFHCFFNICIILYITTEQQNDRQCTPMPCW